MINYAPGCRRAAQHRLKSNASQNRSARASIKLKIVLMKSEKEGKERERLLSSDLILSPLSPLYFVFFVISRSFSNLGVSKPRLWALISSCPAIGAEVRAP